MVGEAESLGGLFLIIARRAQSVCQQPALELLDRLGKGHGSSALIVGCCLREDGRLLLLFLRHRGSRLKRSLKRVEHDIGLTNQARIRPVNRALNHIFQFPDIARPGIIIQNGPRRIAELRNIVPAQFKGHPRGKVVGEEHNIVGPLTQGREKQHLKRQPVEQIGSEPPACGERLEVGIGCPDNPHVALNRLRTADPFKAAVLDHPQDFFLGFERNLSDFVQKEAAVVSGLKATEALPAGSGKSPGFMAE